MAWDTDGRHNLWSNSYDGHSRFMISRQMHMPQIPPFNINNKDATNAYFFLFLINLLIILQ